MATRTPTPKELDPKIAPLMFRGIVAELDAEKVEVVVAEKIPHKERGETTYVFTVRDLKKRV